MMKVTSASLAFYSMKRRPKWAHNLKIPVVCNIDYVLNSQAGIQENDGEREWGNLCRLLLGAKRIYATGSSIYGEKTLAGYLRFIGPSPGTAKKDLSPRDKRILRLLRRLEPE